MPTRRGGLKPHPLTLGLLGLLAAAAVFLLVRHDPGPSIAAPAASWRGLTGAPRVKPLTGQPSLGQTMIVVLRARSLADHVGAVGGEATSGQEQRWAKQARLDQHRLLQQLSFRGAVLQPTFRYTHVLNGVAASIDPATLAILQHAPEVAGIYPVRAAYPATISTALLESADFAPGSGHRPDVGLRGADGRGVEIALLDTGVDPTHPYLRGQVADGIDVVGGAPHALPAASPDNPARLEQHGTEMAGLLVGAGGPGGLAGVATGASILPIRVAGWQRAATGGWAVYGRSDQIVEGLELSVDPNQDGDAHDAARVALLALAEPYASFQDDPLARAVEGASRLDTLVVTPAGNDGDAGASYGSIAGPGGARDGLTVGALDRRVRSAMVRVIVRRGLQVLADERVPLGTEGLTRSPVSLPLVSVTAAGGEGSSTLDPVPVERFFDRNGYSLVAGRAVLAPAGGNPEAVARNAASAGA
ncbi:MAG: minor extracellular serine protease Vpr, partial [Gaiellaceae bacterium]|nr:minor extracellular serine protease Vpr [Gaiellaceae bacterium]